MGAHLKLKVIQEQLSEVSCRINVEYESRVPSAHSATVVAVADPGRRQAQLKAEKEQKARSSVPSPIPIALLFQRSRRARSLWLAVALAEAAWRRRISVSVFWRFRSFLLNIKLRPIALPLLHL